MTDGVTVSSEQDCPIEERLASRIGELDKTTKQYAEGLLKNGGEGAAAAFLSSHDVVNHIHQSLLLGDPDQIAAFWRNLQDALRGLQDAIIMGGADGALDREEAIAGPGGHSLTTEVRGAVHRVTGVPNGPRETRMLGEYRL